MISFNVPPTTGKVDFKKFFPRKKVVVDKLAKKLIRRWLDNGVFRTQQTFKFSIVVGSRIDWENVIAANSISPLTPTRACILLQYLGRMMDTENDLLAIPNGEEEINLILGYIYSHAKHEWKVVFIEHEHEHGKGEEIHIHVRPMDQWGDDVPLLVLGR